ncbi:MAG TPA: NAD(P)/FAD-dependent oxidoreductase [Solirubrobacteraceae bacterium]|nr:NAD(P)/FAD-dependent oxidoreductase [Solirubrobacteraceae bacterium]
MSYDALVVGSGPNGLTAAITLAEHGLRVLVLEASERAGGAVATEELTLPGFKHDPFSSVYPAGAASPVFARMPLADHGLRWVHPLACLAHPLPDGTAVALYRDLDRTVAGLEAVAPGDGERWRAFAEPYVAHFDALRATMLAGFPPLRGPARLTFGIGPLGMASFTRLLFSSAQTFGEGLFAGEGSRGWLYGSAMHSDVPPAGRGSAIAAAYLTLLGHGSGWPSPEGGAGRLAAALLSYLAALGGEVRTGAQVVRIVAERGRVVGVELAGGERLSAPLAIADVMPHALARLAGDALPGRYAKALRRYRYGPATLKVDWALSGPIPWSAPQAREAGTVHLGGLASEVLATTAAMKDGLPERPFMLLGQQSLADPSRAPAGRHTAWAYTHGPTGLDWESEGERHVQRMEAHVERYAPGFRDLILARHVLTPGQLQERNANLVNGDVGGGSYVLGQVLFRPVRSLAPYRTPLRGCYIASAAAFPGGAVHGVPGHAAARLALSSRIF